MFPSSISPSARPSFGSVVVCPLYSASNTYYASSNYVICPFTVCSSTYLWIAPNSTTSNNAYAVLEDNVGGNIAAGNSFSYKTDAFSGCQFHQLRMGCIASYACSAEYIIEGAYNVAPSFAPSEPSQFPSLVPTAIPTKEFHYQCTNNSAACIFFACPGTILSITNCDVVSKSYTCMGDSTLELVDSSGDVLIANDNLFGMCGLCSGFTYSLLEPCGYYTIKEGCARSTPCSGTIHISASKNITLPPLPSTFPTITPINFPTMVPSSFNHTFICAGFANSNYRQVSSQIVNFLLVLELFC